jgi:hypothetical protein
MTTYMDAFDSSLLTLRGKYIAKTVKKKKKKKKFLKTRDERLGY